MDEGTFLFDDLLGASRMQFFSYYNAPPYNIPSDFSGSAELVADQPLVATVNNSNSATGVDNKASYTASNR